MLRPIFALCLAGPFLAASMGARAEAPTPFPAFEAKRMVVPGARTAARPDSSRKRITVQIDPEEQARMIAALPKHSAPAPEAAPGEVAKGSYDWFWEEVSPALANAGSERLTSALKVLNASGKVSSPRLQTLQQIAADRAAPILMATAGTSVSPALVLAVISVESAGRADAVSSAGAAGLMQLMPDTATRFGVTDRMVADQNISGGVRYLDFLMKEFKGDPMLVLAGYNAGEGAVKKHDGVPPYSETRDYVPKVLAAFQIARGLCRTPPELISDGCVFAGITPGEKLSQVEN